MAVIKIIQSKKLLSNTLINYVVKKEKTEEKLITGIGCSSDNAYNAMLQTKLDYGKTDGRQYVHLIQSFLPGEVDPVQAHEIGLDLAKEFKGFQVLVATHKDRKHIHNHLVVNTVSYVDGRKIHSTKEDLRKLKERSNELCRERGLSTIEKPFGRDFYTMSELKLTEKGGSVWKEQLRGAIDEAKAKSKNLVEMKNYLKKSRRLLHKGRR
jgi:hypothetical protein